MNSFEVHRGVVKPTPKDLHDEELRGINQILTDALKYRIQTPDADTITMLVERGEQLHKQWLDHPNTKLILLALQVMAREQSNEATNSCDKAGKSDIEIRAAGVKATTIDRIISYVTQLDITSVTRPSV